MKAVEAPHCRSGNKIPRDLLKTATFVINLLKTGKFITSASCIVSCNVKSGNSSISDWNGHP